MERLTNKRKSKLRLTAHVSQIKIWRGYEPCEEEEDGETELDCETELPKQKKNEDANDKNGGMEMQNAGDEKQY